MDLTIYSSLGNCFHGPYRPFSYSGHFALCPLLAKIPMPRYGHLDYIDKSKEPRFYSRVECFHCGSRDTLGLRSARSTDWPPLEPHQQLPDWEPSYEDFSWPPTRPDKEHEPETESVPSDDIETKNSWCKRAIEHKSARIIEPRFKHGCHRGGLPSRTNFGVKEFAAPMKRYEIAVGHSHDSANLCCC